MLPSSHIFSEQNVMLNLRGNRLSINEPNAGLITSTFNGFKEVIIQKDTNGNIISNSNVGNYIYDSNKHNAVTQITPYTNALPGESCAVAYNFFNQPISIEEGDASTPLSNHRLELFYGADQQRNRMMMYRNDTLKTTCYYISKDYETEVDSANITRHYHYIYGDNGAVALYITNETEGTDSMYYIHTDHVGSYVAITDTGKKVVQRNRFAPFGDCGGALYAVLEAPSPTDTLRGNTTLEFPITRRGFTGHEHYPWFSIINMNGRLYDPVIARFFSPDNFVQTPEFTQGFNRYSYCLNNPLKYTDPTGERFRDVDDWVEDIKTGHIEWMDNVTSPANTPKGYRYVGKTDNDILSYMNINYLSQSQHEVRVGLGITGDETMSWGIAPTGGKAGLTGILDAVAVVSYDPNNKTANNKFGKTFDGVRFDASLISTGASSDADAALDYNGSLMVTADGKITYSQLGSHNNSYCIPANSTIRSASVMYPANSITSRTNFQTATISAGTPNANLQLGPRPIRMEFNLMLIIR